MADSFNKKDREKKKRKKQKEKAERKRLRKEEGIKGEEFMYVDENGNLTSAPPDPLKKQEVNIEDIFVSVPKKEDLEEESKEREGIVKFFNNDKGYGFIMEKGTSYFVHADNLLDPIRDNDKVTFEIGNGPKGPIATGVRLLKK